jgi:hypothetical protein
MDSSVSKEELIRNYSKAIREGNAAVFAGAGLSRASGMVDWKGLLRPLANDINLDVDKETNLLSVAQYYRDSRGTRGSLDARIMEAFSEGVNDNENVRILSRLPIFTYWTTNYDHLLEEGIKKANRNPDIKITSKQLSNMKPNRDCVIYKMHGDVDTPSEAVLTREDYETYDKDRPLFRTALQGDLISKVFLFIGFSFEDPNLAYLLGEIHSLLGEDVHEHYCFFKRIQRGDCDSDEDFGYQSGRQEMQISNLKHYGIQTVFVDDYSEITDILKEIEKASKLRNVFISGSADSYPAPWDKDSVENFATKLAGKLVHDNYKVTSGFGLGIGSAVVNGALDIIYNEKYKHTDEYLCLRPFPQNISDPVERARRWEKYREDIISGTGIAIFIFGNKWKDGSHSEIINANGCIEEFNIARKEGNIIIPIGSTGNAAKEIYDMVKCDISEYSYLEDYIDQLGTEKDVDKLIEIVMNIIRKVNSF